MISKLSKDISEDSGYDDKTYKWERQETSQNLTKYFSDNTLEVQDDKLFPKKVAIGLI